MTEQSPDIFALSPAYFQRLRRIILFTTIAIIPAAIGIGALSGRRSATGWGSTMFALAIVGPVVAITTYLSYKKQVARWQTFRISISSDQVVRTQDGHKEVRLTATSISRIVRIPGRGLLIYAGHVQPAIIIPDTLDRFEDCCNLIQRFRPIDVRTRSLFSRWLAIPAALALMGIYFNFTRSADPRATIGLGCLIVGVMALSAWRIYGSPDIDQRMKKQFAWTLLLVTAHYGFRMWSTWNAPRRIEKEIQSDRLLSLLVKAKPELHDKLRDAIIIAEKNRSGSNGGAYIDPAGNIIAEVLPEYLPICSDEAIINYTKETVWVLERLEADPSDICYEWMHAHGARVDVASVLGAGGLQPLTEAMAGAVESALTSPQAPPDAREAESLRTQAVAKLTRADLEGPIAIGP